MTKKILILDDEENLAESLYLYLVSKGYEGSYCASGAQAAELLKTNHYDLIVSDIQMPEQTGIEFFNTVKDQLKEKKVAFILMTGNVDLLSLQKAYDLGVDEFILKPFDFEDLKIVIDLALLQADPDSDATRFYCVPVNEYMQSLNAYDIYLNINNSYMCLAKKGQELSAARLQNLSKKGLKDIYLSHIDYAKYVDVECAILPKLHIKPTEKIKKLKMKNHLIEVVAKNDFKIFLDPEIYRKSFASYNNYIQLCIENDKIFNLIESMMNNEVDMAVQASRVAFLSIAVATYWKWTHPKILSKITMAALLCEIGLKDNPELLVKKKHEFSNSDIKIFQLHPSKSLELLSAIDGMPDEVLKVASQHHENEMSLGFPDRIAKDRLHPYARLIHGTTEFFEYLDQTPSKDDIKQTVEKLYSFHRKTVSEQVLKSLFDIFGLDAPKDLASVLLPFNTARMT